MTSSPLPVLPSATLEDVKFRISEITKAFVVEATSLKKTIEEEFTWRGHRIVIRAYAPRPMSQDAKPTIQTESLWNYEFDIYPTT